MVSPDLLPIVGPLDTAAWSPAEAEGSVAAYHSGTPMSPRTCCAGSTPDVSMPSAILQPISMSVSSTLPGRQLLATANLAPLYTAAAGALDCYLCMPCIVMHTRNPQTSALVVECKWLNGLLHWIVSSGLLLSACLLYICVCVVFVVCCVVFVVCCVVFVVCCVCCVLWVCACGKSKNEMVSLLCCPSLLFLCIAFTVLWCNNRSTKLGVAHRLQDDTQRHTYVRHVSCKTQ